MNNLRRIINPIEGFQYSVNIALDIYDNNKIKSYIPSNSSLQIIEDILASTDNKSVDRARILTGSYGKGKSHLILYVLALLAGGNKELFATAIKKAEVVNKNLAKNICEYIDSHKKLLPVIVNANGMDLKSTLLQSLSNALNQAKLKNIMPDTFFDAAIAKIHSWKDNFPETYIAFEKMIGQKGEAFISRLCNYEQACYDLFVKLYPSLTSGSDFNPLVGSDVIEVFDSVNNELKQYGYNGIFIVYDEFGKFLEGCVENSSAMDIKLIQDLAEKCNRSGATQLHIMLVSHKSIDNYISKLDKTKVDAWKAVSNRFKSISIDNSEAEIYDMVATVLSRNEKAFGEYVKLHEPQFDFLSETVRKEHYFSEIKGISSDTIAKRCYPLHPYSLLILPRISELVAQNERTIFTFLSSNERYSLPYFLKTDESDFSIIEPDYIYDYFETQFKKEAYGTIVKKQWQITTSALSKLKECDNELSEKIVKTLALIYCINDFETIPPSWDIICDIYSIRYSWAEIESAKEILKKTHLLIELLYKPYVRIMEGSGHDVLGLIQEESYRIEHGLKAKDVFNEEGFVKYLYPIQYNDENEITRYFDFKFIDVDDIKLINENGALIDTNADGVVFAVLIKSEYELNLAIDLVSRNNSQRALFIIPKYAYDSGYIATNYKAINNLKTKYAGKEVELIEELNCIFEDRNNVLRAFVDDTYVRFEKNKSVIYYNGKRCDIRRKSQLSQLLSDIMSRIYFHTPKIVNELINKNDISATIRNARNKILTAIIAGDYKNNLGLTGNGPELNILRSTLIIPGIFVDDEEPHLEMNCHDANFKAVLADIRNFVIQSTFAKNKNFSELYDMLVSPSYGYGLKRGIIPIYIAVVLSQYKEHVAISKNGKEIPLTAALLCDIEHAPNNYSISLEAWDVGKETYIANLENIFSAYIKDDDRASGSFAYVVKAMRRWYLSLPKYVLTTKQACLKNGKVENLSEAALNFRKQLSNAELNPHEFLFETLPKTFKSDEYDAIVRQLRDSFEKLNDTYKNMQAQLVVDIRALFNGSVNESLASVFANFYDDLKRTTKEHSFSGKINMILDIAKHPNNDEIKLVEMIARSLFNLRMSDFTDDIMNSYIKELSHVIDNIKIYDSTLINVDTSKFGYKIVFTDDNGNEITKQFDTAEYTDQGQLLYNDVTAMLEEYGEAISSDEKRQILFRILKELV